MNRYPKEAAQQINVMRHVPKELSGSEKAHIKAIKDQGLLLYNMLTTSGDSREFSIAKTKVEEAVMWAVKGITR